MTTSPELRPPMVVLRSNDCCFLGIARGCSVAGIPIVPVIFDWTDSGPWYSNLSNRIHDPIEIPNPYEHPDEACAAMVELGEQLFAEWGERLMVVPSSDTNLMFLLDYFHELAPYFRLAGDRAFEGERRNVVRKDTAAVLMKEGDVAIPETFACLKKSDIEEVIQRAPFPCVYKPVEKDYGQSFYAAHGGSKAIECNDPGELRERLEQEIENGFELVVQEKIKFGSVEEEIPFYLYADENHEIRMAATGVKEMIQPFPFGTATVLRLSWHDELLELAQKVVRALSWRGILMIEFIRDWNDGQWKVIEVNARPWLCIDFYRRVGLNFVERLYQDWRGETQDWPKLQTPSPELLRESPVHVSLPRAISPHLDGLGRPARIEDVSSWLAAVRGIRSLTFLDPADQEPGLEELKLLARQYGLDAQDLIAAVEGELGDY